MRDLRDGRFEAGAVRKAGPAAAAAVRLSMAGDVPADVRRRVERAAEGIRSGRIHVPEGYDGPGFATPPA